MKKVSFVFVGMLVCSMLLVVGCAPKQSVVSYQPPAQSYTDANEIIVPASFEKAWNATVGYLSGTDYTLDTVEKDSKIITLTTNFSEPSLYADCGQRTVTTEDKVYTYNLADGHSLYYMAAPNKGGFDPSTYPMTRRTNLDTSSKIFFTDMGGGKTKISIVTKYRLNAVEEGKEPVAVMFNPLGRNYHLDKTYTDFMSNDTRNGLCTSKHTFEKAILAGIKRRL